jgi:hypothetical protein
MYALMKESQSSARCAANDLRVWNDALQAVVLALACDEPDPMCSDALLAADPCADCQHRECSRQLMIRRVLELKRSSKK